MAEAFRLQTAEWDRVFPKYMALVRRDLADVLNTKAFFIARRSVVETPKARLGRMDRKTAAILGRIINQRRGARGEKGLYGKEMLKAVEILYAARRRSVAFLKSGWLPAIRALEARVDPKYRRGAARNDRAAKQFGQPKGGAIPARTGWQVVARIENAALSSHDDKQALQTFGGPALQRAFDHEARSMVEYLERKLRGTTAAAKIRTR
jgi:hypothetical protein